MTDSVATYNRELECDRSLLQRVRFPSEQHAQALGTYGQVGVVLSPLCLEESEHAAIRNAVGAIHDVCERIFEAFVAGDAWLTRHFAMLERCREFAVKQLVTWQANSRFDFIFSSGGDFKLLELNS